MNCNMHDAAFEEPKPSFKFRKSNTLQQISHQNSAMSYLNHSSQCARETNMTQQAHFALSQDPQLQNQSSYMMYSDNIALSSQSMLSDVPIADRVKRNNRGSRQERSNEGSEKNAPHSQDSVAEQSSAEVVVHQQYPKPFEYQSLNNINSLNSSSVLLDVEDEDLAHL